MPDLDFAEFIAPFIRIKGYREPPLLLNKLQQLIDSKEAIP